MRKHASLLAPAIALAALALPAAGRAGDFSPHTRIGLPPFLAIDAALDDGAISLEQAISLRDRAVKRPWELEEPWRAHFSNDPVPPWAATMALLENQQWRTLSGTAPRAATRDDYAFPEELPFHIDSGTFPIRVYYSSEPDADQAVAILEAADLSWQKEIVEWGFYAPPLVTAEGLYRIYIGETGEGIAGYMDPFAAYPDVEWDACVSYVMIARGSSPPEVGPVVAHELNHAMQVAMDCLDALAFYENTATFVMSPVFPGAGIQSQNGFLGEFQAGAHHSVSWGEDLGAYWYGGFLWPHFLAYAYEDEANGPLLVRRIWEGAMQDDGFNSTDYMQSIDELLRAEYGADLDTAFEGFSVARFLLDDRAGAALATIKDAQQYASNPPLMGAISVEVPSAHSPQAHFGPEGYGVNYWGLEAPPGFDREVTIGFHSDADGPWVLELFSTDGAGVQRAEAAGGAAQLVYTPVPGEERFLAVVRTGDETFDPESIPAEADYTLTVGPTVPGPSISGIAPSAMMQSETVDIAVNGAHFQDGALVAFSPAGVAVDAVSFVDGATLEVAVTAGPETPVGDYTLTVTNPDGGGAIFYSALRVTELAESGAAPEPGEDCSCGAVGSSPRTALLRLLWTTV